MESTVAKEDVLLLKTPLSFAILTLIAGTIFIGGFLLGFFPSRPQRGLETHVAQLRQQNETIARQNAEFQRAIHKLQANLKVADLRGTAGLMSYRASQNNFGAAAELSTGFFNGVQDAIRVTEDPALKQNLQKILDQRDIVTSALAQANPVVKERLAEIYAEFLHTSGAG